MLIWAWKSFLRFLFHRSVGNAGHFDVRITCSFGWRQRGEHTAFLPPRPGLPHLLGNNQQQLLVAVQQLAVKEFFKCGWVADDFGTVQLRVEIHVPVVDAFNWDPVLPVDGQSHEAPLVFGGDVQNESHNVFKLQTVNAPWKIKISRIKIIIIIIMRHSIQSC